MEGKLDDLKVRAINYQSNLVFHPSWSNKMIIKVL